MEIILETERLYFKPLTKDYLIPLYNICKNETVMKYFPNVLNLEETEVFLNKIISHEKEFGFSLMAVHLKKDESFIGFIGLLKTNFDSHFTPCVEIGWRLSDEFWNFGYATEGAKAVLEYGFNVLKLDEIYSFTASINTSSKNVMEKLNMTYIGNFDHPNLSTGPLVDHILYRIKKELNI